ncbi:MAG: hypothetical protein KQI78_19605 [Deltaproteobacteria bacterium]|nr:hypothetical protein [Deltaproteobacteria bacterium]
MPTGQQILKLKCATGQHAIKLQAYFLLCLFGTIAAAVAGQPFIGDHLVLLLTCHYQMKSEYSKMREAMLDLANLAYERELRRELSRVQRHIDQYREKESKFFNLHDIRLKFYREASDEIWHLYDRLEPDKAVERAVALGLLAADEVPDDIQHTLRHAVRRVS